METPAKAPQKQSTQLKTTALESLGADGRGEREREANKMRRKRDRRPGRGDGRTKGNQFSSMAAAPHASTADRPTGNLRKD